jgi:hypothetical protein
LPVFHVLDCSTPKNNRSLQFSLAPKLAKTSCPLGMAPYHCSFSQTLNTKQFIQRWKITSCGVNNKTPDHASVIAHTALTPANRSQKKLLKSSNFQVLLTCATIESYDPRANLPCSQLAPLSPTPSDLCDSGNTRNVTIDKIRIFSFICCRN